MKLSDCRKLNTFKQIREKLGITQLEVAKIIGVTPQYVSALERGLNELTYHDAYLISKYMGMTPDSLFMSDSIERVKLEDAYYKDKDRERLKRRREEFEREYQKR